MIDLINTQYMTMQQRRDSITRAIHSQSFFNLIDFNLIASANTEFQYGAKVQVDKDFWLTEKKGNYGKVEDDTGATFELSLYIAGTGKSLDRYVAGENLPTPFQTTDINVTPSTSPHFDDRQREILPTLIKRGDNIVARTRNVTAKTDPADIKIVLSGYYTRDDAYITPRSQQGVNESFENPPLFELWKFDVDYDGKKDHILNNDRFARMVLGFGIVNLDDADTPSAVSDATVLITDVYRRIKMNNDPINVAFFAPKQNQCKDQAIYYLPIEHFWEPFSPLKFEMNNTLGNGHGFQWQMLTRTV